MEAVRPYHVKPTKWQLFVAAEWPIKIWVAGFVAFGAGYLVVSCLPSTQALLDWRVCLWLLGAVIVAIPLGAIVGLVAGIPVIWLNYGLAEKVNGGPFKEGDLVCVLVGPTEARSGVSSAHRKVASYGSSLSRGPRPRARTHSAAISSCVSVNDLPDARPHG